MLLIATTLNFLCIDPCEKLVVPVFHRGSDNNVKYTSYKITKKYSLTSLPNFVLFQNRLRYPATHSTTTTRQYSHLRHRDNLPLEFKCSYRFGNAFNWKTIGKLMAWKKIMALSRSSSAPSMDIGRSRKMVKTFVR